MRACSNVCDWSQLRSHPVASFPRSLFPLSAWSEPQSRTNTRSLLCFLAPIACHASAEKVFPGAVDDAYAVYEWIAEHFRKSHITIAGDSAGGGLVLSLQMAIKARGRVRNPSSAVLFCPMLDLRHGSERQYRADLEAYDIIQGKLAKGCSRAYLTDSTSSSSDRAIAGSSVPLESACPAVYGDLSALCPNLVQCGSHEIFLPECTTFSERARAAGSDVRLSVYSDMTHVFQTHSGDKTAEQAVSDAGQWIIEVTGGGGGEVS